MEDQGYKKWHLARNELESHLTEIEWGVIRFYESFSHFVVAASSAVGNGNHLNFAEYLILHVVRMHDRPKSSATIIRLMNRDDLPNVQYSLRKLESTGLVCKTKDKKKGSPTTYAITEHGKKITEAYYHIKTRVLTERLEEIQIQPEMYKGGAHLLTILTGIFEEAARHSAMMSLEPRDDEKPDEQNIDQ